MNEKELETMVGEGVEKLITVRENERALQEKLSELKTIFNEENANLFEDLAEVKAMVLEQEEIVKGQRMHHYDITKDKTKLSGIGIRTMKVFEYDKPQALNWAIEHKVALKLDEPAFKKIAVVEGLDFVEVKEKVTATIGSDLRK